jgi:hypothetical protein
MTEFDYVAGVREALLTLHRGIETINRENGTEPAAESKASTEQADPTRGKHVVSAQSIGIQLLELGAEHLTAFVKTIGPPAETLACWTCVRSMLEPCALVGWLLDEKIDARDRTGRLFALRREGIDQQLKWARVVGRPEVELQLLRDRDAELEREARQAGCRGRKSGAILNPVPSATQAIGDMLDLEAAYRLLSAVTHGHHWAVRQLGFKPVAGLKEDLGGVKVQWFEKNLLLEGVAYLATITAKALTNAVYHQYRYFGWNSSPLVSLMNDALKTLRVNP